MTFALPKPCLPHRHDNSALLCVKFGDDTRCLSGEPSKSVDGHNTPKGEITGRVGDVNHSFLKRDGGGVRTIHDVQTVHWNLSRNAGESRLLTHVIAESILSQSQRYADESLQRVYDPSGIS